MQDVPINPVMEGEESHEFQPFSEDLQANNR